MQQVGVEQKTGGQRAGRCEWSSAAATWWSAKAEPPGVRNNSGTSASRKDLNTGPTTCADIVAGTAVLRFARRKDQLRHLRGVHFHVGELVVDSEEEAKALA